MHPFYSTVAERAHHRCGEIVGISSIGLVTAKHLEMNSPSQITARLLWIRLDLFP